MRKIIFGLSVAILPLLFSCSNKDYDTGMQREGMVDFTIQTSIPQGIKTYAPSNPGSGQGGIGNVDPASYDLRYIMEVWTTESTPRVAVRKIQIAQNFSTPVIFTTTLLAQHYNFVFWADFVKKGTKADLFYNTNTGPVDIMAAGPGTVDVSGYTGLTDIEIIPDVNGGITESFLGAPPIHNLAEAHDAYFGVRNIDLSKASVTNNDLPGSTTNQPNIVLTRPFGKFRLVSTDAPENVYFGDNLSQIKSAIVGAGIAYSTNIPSGFNALTGTTTGATIAAPFYALSPEVSVEQIAAIGNKDAIVLAFDYIFTPTPGTATQTVAFNAVVAGGSLSNPYKIGNREISNIPIERNKLTTIFGKFFTQSADLKVLVSDGFIDDPINIDLDKDAQIIDADGQNNIDLIIPNHTIAPIYTFKINGTINSGATITLKDETNPSVNGVGYEGEVYLVFEKTPPALGSFTIDLPFATVYINGINVTTMTASVSDNTLHIDKTCKIGTLDFQKGKVEIERGATITTINKGAGTKVFYGATTIAQITATTIGGVVADVFFMNDIIGYTSAAGGVVPNDGCTIDGKGHSITTYAETATATQGVFNWNGSSRNNITIKNMTIINTAPKTGTLYGHGFNITNGSKGNVIENVKVVLNSATSGHGINLNASDVTVLGDFSCASGMRGISLANANNTNNLYFNKTTKFVFSTAATGVTTDIQNGRTTNVFPNDNVEWKYYSTTNAAAGRQEIGWYNY